MVKKEKRKCLICNNIFIISIHDTRKKYCSTKCKYIGFKKDKVKREKRVCKGCGNIFVVKENSRKKYCDVKCVYEKSNRNRKGEIRTAREKRKCIGCGIIFDIIITDNKKYCTRECFLVHLKEIKGPKHPMYGKHHNKETRKKIKRGVAFLKKKKEKRFCKTCKKEFIVTYTSTRKYCTKNCADQCPELNKKKSESQKNPFF